MYSVGEGDGQVEVCTVLTGQTDRNITAAITIQSDTASGKVIMSIFIALVCIFFAR